MKLRVSCQGLVYGNPKKHSLLNKLFAWGAVVAGPRTCAELALTL